ncbi:type VI secretion system Vgr family protein [Acidovorax cavernicola]|uniref:Type VI secretion system tip protein VgrG n=1 Tax=Acidovorax cavernicola TaxID=1675792 RepID=A0A9X8GSL0_9BURK|nr:type VI secretion system tip protein VgrG [Acidovorax cavernicola]RIX74282.1 type VI secretion system tip protein VgrG [Acidovorax cavernicola]
MDRVVKAHTPLAEDQLLFRSMHGSEGLSQLFEFEVDLLSPNTSVDMKALLGKPLALEIQTLNGSPRYLNGQITRFTMIGREGGSSRYIVYRASVKPWLWYLTRTSDCKIFQNKSVVEILEEVLGEYGFAFEKKLSASYRQWEYCVQYQETDFAFVSRLMEHEGIYYYFKHEKNQHTLVLADDMGAHDTLPGYPKIGYLASDRTADPGREVIDQWEVTEEIRPGTYVVDDFDFKKPKADLLTTRSQPRGNDHGRYEMYEWMGGYSDAGQGEHYARIRLEEAQAQAEVDIGHTNVRGMAPGYRFTMQNAPRNEDNREYLVVSVTYSLREGGYASGGLEGEYSFDFGVQPTSFPFRARRVTRVPRTLGPQTATVVGPPGEDIWIDKYGRVKVQFRWDRYGQRNEDSSCWVRVSSAWAGSNFGAVNHPRVGQEVIVDFIAGCPDRPIIIGRVYNADQMPPLELPAKATVSGFISRTIKGDGELANHFIIDDDPGCESIKIHAQKDFTIEVEADETHTVEGNRTTTVEGHESATYKTGEERHIQAGALETIDGGEERHVTGGAFETVSGGELRMVSDGAMEIVTGGQGRIVVGGQDEVIFGHMTETVLGPVSELTIGPVTDITVGPEIEMIVGPSIELTTGLNVDIMGSSLLEGVAGSHLSFVDGAYHGEASTVHIEATGGNVDIVASGDVRIEGDNVKRINRTKVWDTAPQRETYTDGLNYGENGTLEIHSNVAKFFNGFQGSMMGAQLSYAGGKLDYYGISLAFGIFTTTQTAVHLGNKGFEMWSSFKIFN